MVYHSNNLDEMKLCFQETKRKLFGRRGDMMTSYLELFMKKKIVSTSAISSLSYVFNLFGLSESKGERGRTYYYIKHNCVAAKLGSEHLTPGRYCSAADLLVSTAKSMRKAPASRGKLLFFGERILKSPEGHLALQPIRDMLASNYRSGGAEIVAVAQKTMGESAYKTMVVSYGEDQETLTPGFDILGVSQEKAEEIFNEVVSKNFKSDAEEYYAYQDRSVEYDKHGNVVVDSLKEAVINKDKEDGGGDDGDGDVDVDGDGDGEGEGEGDDNDGDVNASQKDDVGTASEGECCRCTRNHESSFVAAF